MPVGMWRLLGCCATTEQRGVNAADAQAPKQGVRPHVSGSAANSKGQPPPTAAARGGGQPAATGVSRAASPSTTASPATTAGVLPPCTTAPPPRSGAGSGAASPCTAADTGPPPAPLQACTAAPPAPSGGGVSASSSYLQCQRFTHEEVLAMTKSYHSGHVLGEGGFGRVYRGVLADGRDVAVKALNPDGLQGDHEFYVEACMLATLRHPNLVPLLGICDDGSHRVCVTEFMHRGSLRSRLDDNVMPMLWQERLRVALDAAHGLAFLHESDDHPPVVHRDFKSANVLIDAFGNGRVADFGLAKSLAGSDQQQRAVSTVGTYGYIAPEYMDTGLCTTRADCYAFGVVLLELMTGAPAVDVGRGEGAHIVEWVRHRLGDPASMRLVVDPGVRGVLQAEELAEAASLAAACLQADPRNRPPMSYVAEVLESMLQRFCSRTEHRGGLQGGGSPFLAGGLGLPLPPAAAGTAAGQAQAQQAPQQQQLRQQQQQLRQQQQQPSTGAAGAAAARAQAQQAPLQQQWRQQQQQPSINAAAGTAAAQAQAQQAPQQWRQQQQQSSTDARLKPQPAWASQPRSVSASAWQSLTRKRNPQDSPRGDPVQGAASGSAGGGGGGAAAAAGGAAGEGVGRPFGGDSAGEDGAAAAAGGAAGEGGGQAAGEDVPDQAGLRPSPSARSATSFGGARSTLTVNQASPCWSGQDPVAMPASAPAIASVVDPGLHSDAVDPGLHPDAVDPGLHPDAVNPGLHPDAVNPGLHPDAPHQGGAPQVLLHPVSVVAGPVVAAAATEQRPGSALGAGGDALEGDAACCMCRGVADVQSVNCGHIVCCKACAQVLSGSGMPCPSCGEAMGDMLQRGEGL